MQRCLIILAFLAVVFSSGLLTAQSHAASLAGSEWIFIDDELSRERGVPYLIKFAANGVLNVMNDRDTTPNNDRWEQYGDTIVFWYNDKYAKHVGTMVNSNFIVGSVTNVKDLSWNFRLVRRNWP
jgi:hypothetical protein